MESTRGGGGGPGGRGGLLVLISFPFFSNSINYLASDPKLNLNRHFSPFVKHVSSYTNSFAESKHYLKEREETQRSFGRLPRDLEWNNLYDLTFRVLSLSIIFRLWIPDLNITQTYLYGTHWLTAPVSSRESTPCDFKVCNNKSLVITT